MNKNLNITNPRSYRGAAVASSMVGRGFSAPSTSTYPYPYIVFPTPQGVLEALSELAASRAVSKAAGRRVPLFALQREYTRELTGLVSSLVRR